MFRLSLLSLAVASLVLAADKPKDAAAIKKEIDTLSAKLAELKAELARCEGEPSEFKDTELLRLNTMKVGESGRLAYATDWKFQKVAEVIDEETAILNVDQKDRTKGQVVARGFPTKGLVDGRIVVGPDGKTPQYWGVVGTEKRNGETLFVVRPLPTPSAKR